VEFSDAEAGALYSQLSGVLAGFSFAGLIVLVTSRLDGSKRPQHIEDAMDRSLVLLLASFLGLTITSLGYAVVGGEMNNEVAGVEHVPAGVAFAVSALLLLLAILELLRVSAEAVADLAHNLIAIAAPLITVVYVVAGAHDVRERRDEVTTWFIVTILSVIATQVLVTIYAHFWVPGGAQRPLAEYRRLAVLGVWLAAAASISVPVISSFGGDSIPYWPVWVALGATVIGVGGFTYFAALSRHPVPTPP
jgi:hypothetical protein